MRIQRLSGLFLGVLVGLAGCSKGEAPSPATTTTQAKTASTAAPATKKAAPVTPTPAKGPAILASVGGEAAKIFRTRCATCHGLSGKGDGAAAASFPVKPRSFADPEWRKNVTDDQIRKVIVEGGAAVGKSPLMAPNIDLKGKTEALDGLVKIIRGIK